MQSERKRMYDREYQRENTVLLTLRLHKIGDADILRALDERPAALTRSGYLKEMLRKGFSNEKVR